MKKIVCLKFFIFAIALTSFMYVGYRLGVNAALKSAGDLLMVTQGTIFLQELERHRQMRQDLRNGCLKNLESRLNFIIDLEVYNLKNILSDSGGRDMKRLIGIDDEFILKEIMSHDGVLKRLDVNGCI